MTFFCRLHDEKLGGDIYLAFNAHDYFVKVVIPSPPQKQQWHRVVRFFPFSIYTQQFQGCLLLNNTNFIGIASNFDQLLFA